MPIVITLKSLYNKIVIKIVTVYFGRTKKTEEDL